MKKQPYLEIIDLKKELKEYKLLCKGKSKKFKYYSDWKHKMIEKFSVIESIEELENIKRYFMNKERLIPVSSNVYLQITISIVTVFLSSCNVDYKEFFIFLCYMIITFIIATTMFKNSPQNIFYRDLIEILEEIKKEGD